MRNHCVFVIRAVVIALCLSSIPFGTFAATTSCATVAACVFGINTTSGSGVEGQSSSGLGIEGVSGSGYGVEGFSKTNDGVVGHTAVNPATAAAGKAGLAGYDDSTNHTSYNSGVYGVSINATGVQGRSTNGPAVYALSFKNNGVAAVAGTAFDPNFTGAGIAAQSSIGAGVIGVGNPTGIVGFSALNCPDVNCATLHEALPSGAALNAGTTVGGLGLNIAVGCCASIPSGVGATISAGNLGMMITSDLAGHGEPGLVVAGDMGGRYCCVPGDGFQGAIIAGYDAMSVTGEDIGIAVTGGYGGGYGTGDGAAIIAQGSASGATLFQGTTTSGKTTSALDDSGNLTIAGKLTSSGTITTHVRNSDGSYSTSYTAHSTIPTVEDMGEANLVGGSAFVAIDPALSRSIDTSRGYLVFLTPQGATTGLFVAAKSAAGFAVREIGGARDSIAFDYRIVAHPFAEQGQRLAAAAASIAPAAQRRALFYRHLKPLRFDHGKLDRTSLPVPSM